MTKITTILFDFDGVIADTEPQYDIFAEQLAQKYNHLPTDFALQCRGVTLDRTLDIYFNDFRDEIKEQIRQESDRFELEMEYPWVAGVKEFILYLKTNSYKIGLVTSSPDIKMEYALNKLDLKDTFDTMVTADRITVGKPDPMCYLLAAKDLGAAPSECLVFEDSIYGIQSATDAGMGIIGLTTSFSEAELKDVTDTVIPDFSDLKLVVSLLI